MRPTDEDQPGSRRPNLMSSGRRAANEVNILDMLDRQASGALPRRMLRRALGRPAMLWYGAAGLLVCGLVGTLAWLAHDGTPSSVDTVLAGSIKPVEQMPEAVPETVGNAPLVASVSVSAPDSAHGAAPVSAPLAGAAIVDAAPPEPAEAEMRTAQAQVLPPQQAAGRIAAREASREMASSPPRLAAHTPPKAAQRPGRSAAHAEPAATRSRRQAAAAKTPAAAPAVDTDVALISAIIQHAANHQEAQDGCVDKACGARKP